MAQRAIGEFSINALVSVQGVPEAKKRVQNFSNTVQRTQKNQDLHTRSSRRGTQSMLELSRAVEDGAAVWGTQGFTGAIRASMNNLSQFLTVLGPAAGIIGGVGAALASTLLPRLFDTKDASKKAEQQVNRLTKAMENFNRAAKRARAFKEFDISLRGMDTEKGIRERMKGIGRKQEVLGVQEDIRKRQLNRAKETLAQVRAEERARARRENIPSLYGRLTPEETLRAARGTKRFQRAKENVDELQRRLGEVQIKQTTLAFKKGRLKNRLEEVPTTEKEKAAVRGEKFVKGLGPRPSEKFRKRQQDLKAALDQELITRKQFNRGMKQARDQFEKSVLSFREMRENVSGFIQEFGQNMRDSIKEFAKKQKKELKTPAEEFKAFSKRIRSAVNFGFLSKAQARQALIRKGRGLMKSPRQPQKVGAVRAGTKEAATTILDAMRRDNQKKPMEDIAESNKSIKQINDRILSELKRGEGTVGIIESFQD